MGDMQIVIDKVEVMTLEELQERAKKEKLFTEGEKVIRASRQDIKDDEVAEAEQVLDVKEEEVTELASDSLFENPKAHQIALGKDVDKEFFVKLKELFEECPGDDDVELVIGEKVIPIPNKVNWEGC